MTEAADPDDSRPPPTTAAVARLRDGRRTIRVEMGGVERLAQLEANGQPTIRDRIDALCDPQSFTEVGTFARSEREADRLTTPGDGKVGGHALIRGRRVTVVGDDITVKRGSSSAIGELKVERLFEQALGAGNPFVYFGETGGARIPDIMQVEAFTRLTAMPWLASRQRRIPTVTAIVGPSFGGSSFLSALTDFVVQVRGSCLAVTSPRVIEIATGERIEMDDLGGVDVHGRQTGQIDLGVETEADAIAAIQDFLDYLPPNSWTAPERAASPGVEAFDAELEAAVPESRRRAYDVRAVIRRLVDHQQMLELKPMFGRSLVTALARIDGYAVGIIASQPLQQAGALVPEACDKATRMLCLCDAFDVPVIFLHDTPGFLVGGQVEHAGMLHHGSRLQQALALCGSPRLTLIVRKSFGMAFQLMCGTGMGADTIYAWPGAEIGFMDSDVAVNIVHKDALEGLAGAERIQEHDRLAHEMSIGTSPFDAAGVLSVDEIIEPGETRAVLANRLGALAGRRIRPPEQRLLSAWPTC